VRDTRDRVLQVLLLLYGLVSAGAALLLALGVGKVGNLRHTTSGKILAAALFTLAFGALMAARAPRSQKLVIQMLIGFASLSALAIVYRLAVEHRPHDLAWLALPFVAAAPVLLLIFYPHSENVPTEATTEPDTEKGRSHETESGDERQ
jgi:hypothetical protein